MRYITALPALALSTLVLAACQPSYEAGQTLRLADGEVCTVTGTAPDGTRLSCPERGDILADIQGSSAMDLRGMNINEITNPEIVAGIHVSDIPGAPRVPYIPPVPHTEAEALCRAGQYAQNRIRGAAEGTLLSAVGLPGNTLGILRRGQRIARRIEGTPAPAGRPDPCAGM